MVKAERNRATHLNPASRAIYLQMAAQRELRADYSLINLSHVTTKQHYETQCEAL